MLAEKTSKAPLVMNELRDSLEIPVALDQETPQTVLSAESKESETMEPKEQENVLA